MRDAGAAGLLIKTSDPKSEINGHSWSLVVFDHEHRQAVGQPVLDHARSQSIAACRRSGRLSSARRCQAKG